MITNDGQPVITNPDFAIVTIVDDNDGKLNNVLVLVTSTCLCDDKIE